MPFAHARCRHIHAALFCFRLQPTWRLGRGVVIFHAKRWPQGHLQCLQNVSFVKGGKNYHYPETFVHTACNNFAGMSRFWALQSDNNFNESHWNLIGISTKRQVYIRLFSRLPHLMRFLSLDVLLQKLYETHYQISHTFCYLWLEL